MEYCFSRDYDDKIRILKDINTFATKYKNSSFISPGFNAPMKGLTTRTSSDAKITSDQLQALTKLEIGHLMLNNI
jgi:hypothetical protein